MPLVCLASARPVLCAQTGEDSAARAALPQYVTIEAAADAELAPAEPNQDPHRGSWTRSQGDPGSRRHSALTEINRGNVASLGVAWTYHSHDGARNIQCTPIVVNGVLIAPTAGRDIVGLDAASGIERWRFKFDQPANPGLEDEPARRGLVYWPGDTDSRPRVLFGSGRWVYAIDPANGTSIAGFGQGGRAALPTGATVGGVVYQGVFVTAGLYGDIFGYDVRNGGLLWRFHTVPQAGEFGADTWRGRDPGQANCWGGLSLDEGRGIIFAAIGAAQPNFIGVDRPGDNLFSDCVLAIDARTGRRLWYFQNIRHDIWDLDNAAAPTLVTFVRGGHRIDAVTCVSKSGVLLLLDRVSGKPVFPFRMKRAPVSDLPGEETNAYQPDPELPEALSHPDFRVEDVTTKSAQAHDFVMKQIQGATYGWFRPFSEGRTNLFMGTRGGGEWSGASFDAATGRLYVTSNRIVSMVTVSSSDEGERDPAFPPSAGEQAYLLSCAVCHGPARAGNGMIPPLVGIRRKMSRDQVEAILRTGRGAMPPAPAMTEAHRADLLDFLFRVNQPPSRPKGYGSAKAPKYIYDGFNFLTDQDGYPGIKPPWGLLNCYDLPSGKILWRVPLGEYPELTRQGTPKTGTQNLGGATTTAGGLVFCAGTADQMIRAFDAASGAELWKAKLPWGGYAAPAVYEANGREFVVIASTGGGKVGGPTGDAYVAYALPGPSSH
ncbi:MAG TPA: PQQ-binding-like beta-propeller repeat protein [Opitutaceae bacterium]|nr:PQQ-binding-like beta-propeller repeat protein [Opitutaceae bacterium]